MLTYGDGVSDVNINDLILYHKSHGKLITMTSVQPEGRYGSLVLNDQKQVTSFQEKPKGDDAWINGGFFVLEPGIFDYIEGDVLWEKQPIDKLAKDNQLSAYKHSGFWKPMDTLRDKQELENLWLNNKAQWKVWD